MARSFDLFFDLRLKNGWISNEDTGDLRRYYVVTVMHTAEETQLPKLNDKDVC